MSVTVSSIQSWLSQVQSTLTSLPAALEEAAPTGGFAAVLAQVGATIDAGPGGAGSSTALTAGTPTRRSATIGTASAGAASYGGLLATAAGGGIGGIGGIEGSGGGGGVGGGGIGGVGGSGGVTGQDVVDEAAKFEGTPYVWGGDSPTGFDCSGLVQYVYGQLGVSLPRTSEEQALVGTSVPSLAQAQPGDLVFFAGSDGTATSPGHVGIYVGNGEMIDAPYTGTDVQVQPVSTAGTVVAIRHVLSDRAGVAAGAGSVTAGAGTGSTAGVGVPAALRPLFTAAANRYSIPVSLLTAVARHESGFDTDAVSTAGAEGLMQLMPGTAAGLGVTPFTPGQAIDGAAQMLSGLMDQFGSVPLALAAYNAGPGAVEQYGGIPPYTQTQAYVQSILQTLGDAA